MKYYFLVFITFFFAKDGFAQTVFHVGPWVGVSCSFNSVTEGADIIKAQTGFDGIYGFEGGVDFNNAFSLNAGFFKNAVSPDFYIMYVNSSHLKEIPLSTFHFWQNYISTGYQIGNKRVSFQPFVGISSVFPSNIHSSFSSNGGYFKSSANADSVSFDALFYQGSQMNICLLSGCKGQYKIMKSVLCWFAPVYYAGLNSLIKTEIAYRINQQSLQKAYLNNKGSQLNFTIGMEYHFSL